MPTRLLYQFPGSHFCEKSRWNLDYKGLPYAPRNLLPGPHLVQARRLVGSKTLPILADGGRYIADSTAIALHLEQTCATPGLLPTNPADRARVLALEERYDKLGEDVRRWVYNYLIPLPDFSAIFFRDYALPARWLGYAMTPVLRRVLVHDCRIKPANVLRSLQLLRASLDQLEAGLGHDPARYLVGGRFTLADLSAAALLAPLLGPPGSPWADATTVPELLAMRRELGQRVAGQWIARLYREHRRPAGAQGGDSVEQDSQEGAQQREDGVGHGGLIIKR